MPAERCGTPQHETNPHCANRAYQTWLRICVSRSPVWSEKRFKLPWRTADHIEHLGRCSLLLERLVQPVLEQPNPFGCIDAGRLALMSDLRRHAGLHCTATLCFCSFAARFVAPSHCLS